MGNIRSDTDHIRRKCLQKADVADKLCGRLVRGTYHKACTDLIADLLQVIQTAFAVSKRHGSGMQLFIVRRICRFVAQQIAPCTCIKIGLIVFSCLFADGECNSTVGKCRMDRSHKRADPFCCKIKIFPALQDKGTKAECIAFSAAGEDFFFCQPVAVGMTVSGPDTAIVAVIFAVIGKLDQTAHKNSISVHLSADKIRFCKKTVIIVCRIKQRG